MAKEAIPYGTADLETDPFKKGGRFPDGRLPVAFMSCFYDGKVSTIFEGKEGTTTDCCAALVAACVKFRGIIYLHSGGKFDLHFLLVHILRHFAAEDLKLTCIGPRLVALKTPTVEFRDSYALIPKPLKSLSTAQKKDIEFWKLEEFAEDLKKEELEKFRADIKKTALTSLINWPSPRAFYRSEIIEYLRQDCKGLAEAVQEFIELYGRNLTLASAAFNVLRKQFGMPVVHTKKKYDNLFRNFYFAGRVQFFALGKQEAEPENPIKILDINSAFPAAMTRPHWFSAGYKDTDIPPTDSLLFQQSFHEIICDSRGALPVRTQKGIIYPEIRNGSFFATGWELFAGVECGLVSNVQTVRCYSPLGTRSFEDYVGHFYALKKDAKTVSERDFAKLFLNSAYGKFSQNPRVFSEVIVTKYREHGAKHMDALGWSHSYDDERRGLSFYQKPTYQEDGRDVHGRPMRFYNVSTAASITGFVRAFLLRSMHACGGVLYCDTDSIICRDASPLKVGAELGEWKLEMNCSEVHIGGKKLYAAKNVDQSDPKKAWKKASKGVRLTVEQIQRVCRGEAESYSFEAPNYSVFSEPRFTTRTVRRDDKRKSA